MTYVMSDLHGNYQKYLAMLEKISFGDDDILYVLGDVLDYGEETMELIADLSVRVNVYPIAGEHDFLGARMLKGFERMLKNGATPEPEYIAEMTQWVQDGGQSTLDGFRALDDDEKEGVLEYLEEMALYEEAEIKGKSYTLVHAGIADYTDGDDLDDFLPEDFFSGAIDPSRPLMQDRIVIAGHMPTKSGKIERGEGCILIDCGVAEGGQLGCLCLETGKEYYV